MKITEEVAKKFAHAVLKIEVHETNRETLEESLKETIEIDLSCILFPKKSFEVIYCKINKFISSIGILTN